MGCSMCRDHAKRSYHDNAMYISNPVPFYRAILYNAVSDGTRAYGGINKEESKK